MAIVISWVISIDQEKRAYIEPKNGKHIRYDEGTDYAKELGKRVTNPGLPNGISKEQYDLWFDTMYREIIAEYGYSVDIINDPDLYYGATSEQGVYMLTGINGANIADTGKSFFNLVLENSNVSIGLGGDYKLDVPATIKTTLYLERDGYKFVPDPGTLSVSCPGINDLFNFHGEVVGDKFEVTITLLRGILFDESNTNGTKTREFTISVGKGSWSGSSVFSVTGLKEGQEGVSYDLVVYPKQIKINEAGNYDNTSAKCWALKNGLKMTEQELSDSGLSIKMKYGAPTSDVDDIHASYVYEGSVSVESIVNSGYQVTFYLIYNNTQQLIDSDSCTVTKDGEDGGHVFIELDNEIDGVSVGDDYDLDLEPGVSVKSSTDFTLYSGSTPMDIIELSISDFSDSDPIIVDAHKKRYEKTVGGNVVATAEIETIEAGTKGRLTVLLYNGFDFGTDRKDYIKISARGTNEHGQEGSADTNFVILAIPGGNDGDVFKLIANYDEILYNPNPGARNPYVEGEMLTVDAFVGLNKITDNANWDNEKQCFVYGSREYCVRYSKNITYNTYGNTTAYTSTSINILNEATAETKYVAFYLFVKDTDGAWLMADRESIPFIYQGKDGNAVWVELGNEVDAVSVGDDSDLDLDEDITSVTLTTDVRLFSGGTPMVIDGITGTPVESETLGQYDRNAGKYEFNASPNGSDDTRWIINITLKNGFEFGPDLREKIRIKVANVARGYEGYAYYTITGVKGGKDGYVYRLVPEADYVHYHTNMPPLNRLDENQLRCTAFYGDKEIGDEWEGTIYYSINRRCTSIDDTGTTDYTTGMTVYDTEDGVNLRALNISDRNYKNFKYIVFYLTLKDSNLIIDRETVPFIIDGIDGHDNLVIELGNEIDSIGVGNDTKLDIVDPVTASTTVRLISGSTILYITGIGVSGFKDPNPAHYNTETRNVDSAGNVTSIITSRENPSKTVSFFAYLKNGFNFGDDLKEKVLLTVSGLSANGTDIVTACTTFVIAAIKGGADGVSYKIHPTPDMLLYDYETGNWAGGITSVSARAYANGRLMSEQGYAQNTDYQIKIGTIVWDFEEATSRWNESQGTLQDYTEGSAVGFSTVDNLGGREQMKVFYLAVKLDGSDRWTVVDRETVSLHVSGKNGKDGSSTPMFDLTNLIEVITTGNNNILDANKTIKTNVRGKMGTNRVPINVTTSERPYTNCTVSTSPSSNNEVTVTINLSNGFNFTTAQTRTFTIDVAFANDASISDTLTFTIKSIQEPDAPEGTSYKLMTNVPEVVATSPTSFSPQSLQAGVYAGSTIKNCNIGFFYRSKTENQATIGTLMDISSYDQSTMAYTGGSPRNVSLSELLSNKSFPGTLYIGAFSGNTFIDAEDIPIIVDGGGGGGGSASGVLADLSDDVGVVATGKNKKLEANATLKTKAFIRNGFDRLQITDIEIDGYSFPNTYTYANGGKIKFTAGSTPSNEVEITASISASTSNYIDFTGNNPLQFNITITAETDSNEEVYASVGYSILGLEGGKDGQTIHLELNSDQIYYDGVSFSPDVIYAKLFVNGVDVTSDSNVTFDVKNSDIIDDSQTELWLDFDDKVSIAGKSGEYGKFTISSSISEYQPLSIRAKSGNTVMDWETVQIYRDGKDGKDGEGGLVAMIEPETAFVQASNGHPVEQREYSAIVSLWTGSTQDTIQSVKLVTTTLSGTYTTVSLGSNGNIQAKINDDSTLGPKYKRLTIKVPTALTINTSIQMLVTVQSGTETDEKRFVTFTIEPNQAGQDGQNGRNGAAILGPTEFGSNGTSGRRWHSGNDNVLPGDTATEEDMQFLDIIVRVENSNPVYYFCNTSYTDTGAAWSSVSSRWTRSNVQYDFVAAKVLLAKNAKIEFLTGNEIYLMDPSGDVTGGARAASNGDDVVFWAGSDQPRNGNFQVTYDGDLIARSGTFSGYIQFPFTNLTSLTKIENASNYYDVYSADTRAYIISYPRIAGDVGIALALPAPSSGLNGFTYDIIVHPRMTRSEDGDLKVYASNGTNIDSYAFSYYKTGNSVILSSGRFQFACIPSAVGDYKWALISASGSLVFINLDENDEETYDYVSTVLSETNNALDIVGRIFTYRGEQPSGWLASSTMYVKKP